MEKNKIDRVIEAFRNYINLKEEMMTANPLAKGGGVGGQVDPTGKDGPPGFDPVIGLTRRKKYAHLGLGSRKRWMKKTQSQ